MHPVTDLAELRDRFGRQRERVARFAEHDADFGGVARQNRDPIRVAERARQVERTLVLAGGVAHPPHSGRHLPEVGQDGRLGRDVVQRLDHLQRFEVALLRGRVVAADIGHHR